MGDVIETKEIDRKKKVASSSPQDEWLCNSFTYEAETRWRWINEQEMQQEWSKYQIPEETQIRNEHWERLKHQIREGGVGVVGDAQAQRDPQRSSAATAAALGAELLNGSDAALLLVELAEIHHDVLHRQRLRLREKKRWWQSRRGYGTLAEKTKRTNRIQGRWPAMTGARTEASISRGAAAKRECVRCVVAEDQP